MQYLFQHPMPIPWLLADLLTLALTLLVVVFIVRKSRHPAVVLLECFAFAFLYASVFENFAVVQGWYVYGRSLLASGVHFALLGWVVLAGWTLKPAKDDLSYGP